jgi:hypothetical protein
MQAWLLRLPAAARALITGAMSSAAIFGVMTLFAVSASWGDNHQSVIARAVLSTVAGMVAGIAGVLVGDQRMRRTYGSAEQAIVYSRALRTGELPAHIEPGTWQRWLAVSRQSNKWAPAAVGVFAVLAVLQIVSREWAPAALFVAFAIWQTIVALVLRYRIARLEAAVGGQAVAAG